MKPIADMLISLTRIFRHIAKENLQIHLQQHQHAYSVADGDSTLVLTNPMSSRCLIHEVVLSCNVANKSASMSPSALWKRYSSVFAFLSPLHSPVVLMCCREQALFLRVLSSAQDSRWSFRLSVISHATYANEILWWRKCPERFVEAK